jgi:hypothetical protein
MSFPVRAPVVGVVLVLVLGLVVPSVAIEASAVVDASDPPIEIDRPTDSVGEVVDVTVRFDDRRRSTLSLQGNGHDATLRLDDYDGDGRAVVRIYTNRRGARAYSIESAVGDVNASGAFGIGTYDVTVAVDGEAVAETNLTLQGPRVDALRRWRGPPSLAADLGSERAVRAALDDGSLTAAQAPVIGETLVIGIEASGLAAAYELSDADSERGRLRDAVAAADARLTVRRNGSSVDREPLRFDPLRDARAVLAAPERDTYYVVIDTDALADGGREGGLEPGDELFVGFGFGVDRIDAGDGAGRPGLTTARVRFTPADATVAGGTDRTVELVPAADERLRGTASFAPGTELAVVLTGPDGQVHRATTTAEAAPGNRSAFAAPFDLSNVSAPAEFGVTLVYDGRAVVTVQEGTTVHVRARAGEVAFANGTTSAGTVRVRASAAHDAVVGIHARGPNGSLGPTLGELSVPAGNASARVELAESAGGNDTLVAILYRDEDASGNLTAADRPYLVGGEQVTDVRNVSAGTDGPTRTEVSTTFATLSPTPAAHDRTNGPRTDGSADSSATSSGGNAATASEGPGFGAGTAALALLLSAAVAVAAPLARRRG